jgi:ribonuclease Y
MEMFLLILGLVLGAGGGIGVGYYIKKAQGGKKLEEAEKRAKNLLEKAEREAKELVLEAKNEALKISEAAKKEEKERRAQLDQLEERLSKRSEQMDARFAEIEKKYETIENKEKELSRIKDEILKIKENQVLKLEKIAKMNKNEAKSLLLENIEKEAKDELVAKIREVKARLKEEAEKEARKIISTAIQRYAGEQSAEMTTFALHLPSDEMKGRIIGKEGRNIQALERALGVDLIVDDTPETVVVSSFDPVRRTIAKLTLEKLISDGRINPARVEEVFAKVKEEVNKQIKETGEQAILELGLTGLHPDLAKILGRLRYRTSYGQNVLLHSMESAHLAGLMAAEIGADVKLARMCGLFHDLGKALDHEMEGSHVELGAEIAKKYALPEEVINTILAHHGSEEPKFPEAALACAADAISGARPGARRESLEAYIKRLSELENLANSFKGVEKSYAIQAGREVRVIVKPEEIDDLTALKLARDIADKIEQTMTYPGEIKVQVIRETRAQEVARSVKA